MSKILDVFFLVERIFKIASNADKGPKSDAVRLQEIKDLILKWTKE